MFEYANLKTYSNISQSDIANDSKIIYVTVPSGVVVIMSLIFAIAPFCSILWLRFLKDQPLDRQCLVNNLLRDLIKTNTLFVCLLNILAFFFGIFEVSQESSILILITKYLVLMNEAIVFVMMEYLCLIASMRLYTIRFKVLDPVDEFLGEYNIASLIFIRILILVMPIFTIGMLYSNSIQPILYYQLIEKNTPWKDIPHATRILYAIDMTLITISVTLFAFVKIYQWAVQSKKTSHVLENGAGNNVENINNGNIPNPPIEANNESSNNPQESGERNWYDLLRMVLPNLLHLVIGLLIVVLLLLDCVGVLNFDIWWSLTTLALLQGVVFPISIILWFDNLRMYCLRQITCHINVVIPQAHRALCFYQMFNNAVNPIE